MWDKSEWFRKHSVWRAMFFFFGFFLQLQYGVIFNKSWAENHKVSPSVTFFSPHTNVWLNFSSRQTLGLQSATCSDVRCRHSEPCSLGRESHRPPSKHAHARRVNSAWACTANKHQKKKVSQRAGRVGGWVSRCVSITESVSEMTHFNPQKVTVQSQKQRHRIRWSYIQIFFSAVKLFVPVAVSLCSTLSLTGAKIFQNLNCKIMFCFLQVTKLKTKILKILN